MTRFKVGYFVGSLATASINRLLAGALVRLAPPEPMTAVSPIRRRRSSCGNSWPSSTAS